MKIKALIFLFLIFQACTVPPHFDEAIIGDSRVNFGYWEGVGICNHGINGDSAAGVLARLEEVTNHAETVYIQVGRNDLAYYGRNVSETFQDYKAIINQLISAGIRPIVFSTIPDDENNQAANVLIEELNVLLFYYCQANGVEYVDINIDLAPSGFLIYHVDGVHLNSQGYDLWLEAIKGIKQWLS